MNLISSLVAHIKALKSAHISLADELAKLRDRFEGKASADGAAKVKAANAATTASVEALHTEVDATVSEAQAHLDSVATTPVVSPPAPEQEPVTAFNADPADFPNTATGTGKGSLTSLSPTATDIAAPVVVAPPAASDAPVNIIGLGTPSVAPVADPKPGEPTLTAADFPGGVMPTAPDPVNAPPAPANTTGANPESSAPATTQPAN